MDSQKQFIEFVRAYRPKTISFLNQQFSWTLSDIAFIHLISFSIYKNKNKKKKYFILSFNRSSLFSSVFKTLSIDFNKAKEFVGLIISDCYEYSIRMEMEFIVNMDCPDYSFDEKTKLNWETLIVSKDVISIQDAKYIVHSDSYELYRSIENIKKKSRWIFGKLHCQYMFNPNYPEHSLSVLDSGKNVGIIFRKGYAESRSLAADLNLNHKIFNGFSSSEKLDVLNNFLNVWIPRTLGIEKTVYCKDELKLMEKETTFYDVIDGTESKLRFEDKQLGCFIGFVATNFNGIESAMDESYVFGQYVMIKHRGVF